jgi:GDP-L-fucose synthase
MRVLVTGGSGLVGLAIHELNSDWTYISSNECNLLDSNAFSQYLKSNPTFDFVIHLAANVGGLFKNQAQKVKMFQDNLRINLNVIETCFAAGIPRMICCLSTCVFPDGMNQTKNNNITSLMSNTYVMNEDDLHNGEPHESNYGYAYAKRIIDIHCRLINNNSDGKFFYQSIIPTNIYGPYDQFGNPANAHVIPALICKAAAVNKQNGDTLQIRGSGLPVRQFIYSRDLAKIITRLVIDDIRVERLICAPDAGDERSIIHVASLIAENFGIPNVVPEDFNPCVDDGQQTKTCSNTLLKTIMPGFTFTPLKDGIRQTCTWYKIIYEQLKNEPCKINISDMKQFSNT